MIDCATIEVEFYAYYQEENVKRKVVDEMKSFKENSTLQELKMFDASFDLPLDRIAGMDEAGRGAWMGPIVAACVVLPPEIHIEGLNDSKKVKGVERNRLALEIKEKAISWGVGIVHNEEIEREGLQHSNFKAFVLALEDMQRRNGEGLELILLDGTYKNVPLPNYISVKKGDSKSASIAAASILAKTTRDEFVSTVCNEGYEMYSFPDHKGYGTKKHQQAIIEFGLTEWHRPSFCKNFFDRMKENKTDSLEKESLNVSAKKEVNRIET